MSQVRYFEYFVKFCDGDLAMNTMYCCTTCTYYEWREAINNNYYYVYLIFIQFYDYFILQITVLILLIIPIF